MSVCRRDGGGVVFKLIVIVEFIRKLQLRKLCGNYCSVPITFAV